VGGANGAASCDQRIQHSHKPWLLGDQSPQPRAAHDLRHVEGAHQKKKKMEKNQKWKVRKVCKFSSIREPPGTSKLRKDGGNCPCRSSGGPAGASCSAVRGADCSYGEVYALAGRPHGVTCAPGSSLLARCVCHTLVTCTGTPACVHDVDWLAGSAVTVVASPGTETKQRERDGAGCIASAQQRTLSRECIWSAGMAVTTVLAECDSLRIHLPSRVPPLPVTADPHTCMLATSVHTKQTHTFSVP
jgi:hypothetical protein